MRVLLRNGPPVRRRERHHPPGPVRGVPRLRGQVGLENCSPCGIIWNMGKKKRPRPWKPPNIKRPPPRIFGGVLPAEAMTSYLTTAEVAAKLHPKISERRVRELIRAGRLTAFKKGKGYLVHKDAFYAFAAIKRRPGRPKPGETLEILRVTSRITIQSIQNGTDGPTPTVAGGEHDGPPAKESHGKE